MPGGMRRVKPATTGKMTINAMSGDKRPNPVQRGVTLGPNGPRPFDAEFFRQLLQRWFDTAADLSASSRAALPSWRLRLLFLGCVAMAGSNNRRMHAGIARANNDNISLSHNRVMCRQ